MAELPYWFTNLDKSNPMYCRACKQHVPRAILQAGKGLCPNCLSRVKSRSTVTETALAPGPVSPVVPSVGSIQPSRPSGSPAKVVQHDLDRRFKISPHLYAGLILIIGLIIACVRISLKI